MGTTSKKNVMEDTTPITVARKSYLKKVEAEQLQKEKEWKRLSMHDGPLDRLLVRLRDTASHAYKLSTQRLQLGLSEISAARDSGHESAELSSIQAQLAAIIASRNEAGSREF